MKISPLLQGWLVSWWGWFEESGGLCRVVWDLAIRCHSLLNVKSDSNNVCYNMTRGYLQLCLLIFVVLLNICAMFWRYQWCRKALLQCSSFTFVGPDHQLVWIRLEFPLHNLQVPLRLKAQTGVCPFKRAVNHLWHIIRQLFHGTWWIVAVINT